MEKGMKYLKGAVTLAVATVLLGVIAGDAARIRERLGGSSLVSALVAQREKVKSKARAVTLNQLMPSAEDFRSLLEGGPSDPGKIRDCIVYYEKVAEYMPQSAEAYGVLGYLYDRRGDVQRATFLLEKALGMQQRFLPFHYNRGVLAYRHGRFAEAEQSFADAVAVPFSENLSFVVSSRLYVPLFVDLPEKEKWLVLRLKDGYRQSYLMMIQSRYHRKDYSGMMRAAADAIAAGFDQGGEFYYFAGIAAQGMNDPREAVKAFEQAIKRDPSWADPYERMTESLRALGEKDDVLRQFTAQAEVLKKAGTPNPKGQEPSLDLRIF
ncbi:MAG: tetratricopeptide repeat protein [Candidatus Omnitrophota bacterium]|nr:tetratricopeptide repeat protein [Candidatus Omnitrophota bacterium]MDZ4242997.1 tetratricopeptide repeat protein [Candidatus Omnitrophota bacterium]